MLFNRLTIHFVHFNHATKILYNVLLSLNFQSTSKWTKNILFWKEYKEPSLACNWLMTQAAWHVTRTDITHDQIITPQQVQPSLFPLFKLILLQLVFLLHIENICIGGLSLSLSFFRHPPLFSLHPSHLLPPLYYVSLSHLCKEKGLADCK